MTSESAHAKNFFYPPGGILMWLIIFVELLSFGFGLAAFSYYNHMEAETFAHARSLLNAQMATLNTLLLLVSGYFMAGSVKQFQLKNYRKAQQNSILAMMGGMLFILIKSAEYAGKIETGHTLSSNMFFTFYWLLTGFHLIHVLVGLVILFFLNRKMAMNPQLLKLEDLEAGAAFWHMCDLIWLLLFPVLYLF